MKYTVPIASLSLMLLAGCVTPQELPEPEVDPPTEPRVRTASPRPLAPPEALAPDPSAPIRLRVPQVTHPLPLGEDVAGVHFDHTDWDALLKESRGPGGLLDPRPLARNQELLDRYLDRLSRADLRPLSRHEQAALLLNAWNAHTCRLLLRLLERTSTPSPQELVDLANTPVIVARHPVTLSELEHHMLRTDFADPRLCTALFRGTLGGPGLPPQAFVGADLPAQLEAAASRYLQAQWQAHPGKVSSYLYAYRADIARDQPLGQILGQWYAGGGVTETSPLQVKVWLRYDGRPAWVPAKETSDTVLFDVHDHVARIRE